MNSWPKWIFTENHTGSQYPYFINQYDKTLFTFEMPVALNYLGRKEYSLNQAAVIEILHKGYIFGDKTLVEEVNRTPWLAKVQGREWSYTTVYDHSHQKSNPEKVAVRLKEMLYEELLSYIGEHKNIGILLSGGLDSRIIAGLLKEAEELGDFSGNIIVYNWGMEKSRDVQYAREIAHLYEWDYIHYTLSSEVLKENFFEALSIGAEVSPVHLHCMNKVRDDSHSEIIIAGTYGDSLGRGLYSGVHFSDLKSNISGNINKLGLIKDEAIKECRSIIESDYIHYRNNLMGAKNEYQLREVEENVHYLRRLLGTAMSVIAQKKPIYQLFTKPSVVQYIWSLDKETRNDEVYKEILKSLPLKIGSIPYAKTGKSFLEGDKGAIADNFPKNHHCYGEWLRGDLKQFIVNELDKGTLYKLNLFNEKAIENLIKVWKREESPALGKIDHIISWLVVFSMFIERNNVQSQKSYKLHPIDHLNSKTVRAKIKAKQLISKVY
ncbi:asparagine synthase-related protein [Bacillus thermotolerans]|uniref:asparagine synthase-related protein n=1 Tax=Bacillus thermotolerans TaxID=1221996 RepID=UPI00058069C2|nr:asparagine synthase-related protein [Bacillus thermotolerans]KKB35461.1 hypothetical protein QY97_01639 [Bacillus thermotolerans]